MKKLLGLAMAAALLMSCSDDDNGSKVDMSKLTSGKWYYSSDKTIVAGQTVEDAAYVNDCATKKDYTEFAATTFTDVYHDTDCEVNTEFGTYTVSGETITATMGGDTQTGTVKELNSNKLVIEATETFNGVTATYQTTYTKN